MERTRQQQTVAINRGLFLVRYAAAEDPVSPPTVRVAPDPVTNKNIGFLLHPDHSEAVLWQPQSCLVVRALAPGTLSVEVASAQAGGSAAATVRIEPLTQGRQVQPVAPPKRTHNLSPPELGNFRVLGHVTGMGDQLVGAGEWLAGPSAPARIEGLSIDWPDKPQDLEVRYAVKTAKPQTVSGRAMGLGSFAGTRGKAMPIVGLMLEMSGPAAASLQFVVEAIFLGSPATHITGKRVVVSGPTGREPLVGLRMGADVVRTADQSPVKKAVKKPAESTGRVRVFRSRPKTGQPMMA